MTSERQHTLASIPDLDQEHAPSEVLCQETLVTRRLDAEAAAAATFTAQNPTPDYETPRRSTETTNSPSLKFVFWKHTLENTKTAAEQVEDCDIVAIEVVGFPNAKIRRQYNQAATVLVSSTATPLERRYANRFVRKYGESKTIRALLDELQGSDKRIVTLDVNRNDAEYPLLRKALRHDRQFGRAASRNHPAQQLTQHLAKATEAYGKSSPGREERVTEQLDELLESEAGQGTKVGVLLGAIHTPAFHASSRRWPSERVFVDEDFKPQGAQHYAYRGAIALSRHARFRPDKPIPQSKLLRAALDEAHPVEHGLRSDGMSDEEVAALMTRLDEAKRGIGVRLRRLIGEVGTSAEVEAVLNAHDAERKTRDGQSAE